MSVGVAVAVGGDSFDVRLLGGVAVLGGNSSDVGISFAFLPLLHQVRDVGRLVGIWKIKEISFKNKLLSFAKRSVLKLGVGEF